MSGSIIDSVSSAKVEIGGVSGKSYGDTFTNISVSYASMMGRITTGITAYGDRSTFNNIAILDGGASYNWLVCAGRGSPQGGQIPVQPV